MATPFAIPEVPEVLATGTSTVVTGTLVDINHTVWAGATVVARFFATPNLPGPWYWGDDPNFQRIFQTIADSAGNFSLTLPDNTTINPQGSLWEFVIAPAATVQAVVFRLMIAGSAMNISSIFTAQSTQLDRFLIQSFPFPRAYRDSEVAQPPNDGQFYYNTSGGVLRYWANSAWHDLFGGAITSIATANPASVFRTGIFASPSGFTDAPPELAGQSAYLISWGGVLQFMFLAADPSGDLYYRVVSGANIFSSWFKVTTTPA